MKARVRLGGTSFVPVLAAAGVLALLSVFSARAMDFRLAPLGLACGGGCPQIIVADGQIANSTPDEFLKFLRANVGNHDLRTVVLLNSQGGYVVAAMELGQIFRRIGAATVVARPGEGRARFLTGSCLSACVYAFMGGRKRVAPPGSALGIHRMFANEERDEAFGESTTVRVYDNGSLARLLMRYSARMGVSAEVIRFAEHVSSGRIHIVTSAEMSRWRLAGRAF